MYWICFYFKNKWKPLVLIGYKNYNLYEIIREKFKDSKINKIYLVRKKSDNSLDYRYLYSGYNISDHLDEELSIDFDTYFMIKYIKYISDKNN